MSVLDAAVNGPFDVETDDIIAILGVGPYIEALYVLFVFSGQSKLCKQSKTSERGATTATSLTSKREA